MITTSRSKPLTKDQFLKRCPGWLAKGLDWKAVAELLPPRCRPLGLSDEDIQRALEVIAPAMEVAESVSNSKMTQTHRDFINRERYATEYDGTAASTRAHIARMYPDAPIRAEKLKVLLAEEQRRRATADQAAEDWTEIQKRRIPLDEAARRYPAAFRSYQPWEPKAIT